MMMEYSFEDVLTIRNGRNQKAVENPNGKYPIYGSGGIMGYADDFICSGDTVIIGRKGNINNPIYVSEPFWNVDTAFGLESKNDLLNPRYLFYFCKRFDFEKLNKTVTIPSLTKSDLLKIRLNVPELSIQEEIVSKLVKLEKIVQLRLNELQKLDELVKARFVEMFGNLREGECKGIKLGELCNTVSGGTPSTKFAEYYEGDIPWITTTSLGPNHIDGTTAKAFITKKAIDNSATKLIPAGNILFGTRVGVGKSSLNDVDICTNQDIVAIVGIDENRFNKLFIKYVLDFYQPYYNSIKKGATILGITSDDLKNTIVPDVSLCKQNAFETFVEQIDKSKVVVPSKIKNTIFAIMLSVSFGQITSI